MFWIQGAKVSQESLAPPKPCFAPVQLSFAPVQEDFGAFGSKDLLHPLLTTSGTFEVSGPCSRTFGSQFLPSPQCAVVVRTLEGPFGGFRVQVALCNGLFAGQLRAP